MAAIAVREPVRERESVPVVDRPAGCAWKAIDLDVEGRIEADLQRHPSWWRMLFNWLYEYNKY